MGDTGNLEKGLHHYDTLKNYFKDGKIRVKAAGGDEIVSGDINALENLIDSNTPIKYKDPNRVPKSSGWGPSKSIFPRDWTLDDIARVGDYAMSNPNEWYITGYKDKAETIVDGFFIDYKDLTIAVYLDSDRVLQSMFPKY